MALGSASTAALDIRAGRNADEIFKNLTIKMAQNGFNRMRRRADMGIELRILVRFQP